MSGPGHTDDELLTAVTGLLPLLEREAPAAEAAGHLAPAVHKALVEHRLFRLWIPRSFGGLQTDLITGLRVVELLARGDGATGWTVMLGAGAGRFAAFLEPDTAAEVFRPEDAFIAGSSAPSGVARRVEGGYRVNGRWRYGSGAHHATWFTANCFVHDEHGAPEQATAGEPLIRAVAVPAAEVTIHRTWLVTGMRGTGSDDFEISDRFVPMDRTFSLAADSAREEGPLYRLPFMSVAELAFGAVSLGIGRRALDEFATLAATKRPTGSTQLLRDDGDIQARYGRAEAAVRAARAYLYHSAERLWSTVAAGDDPPDDQIVDARIAAVDATARCAAAIDRLQRRTGMSSLYSASAFGRAWRDIHAATQNVVVAVDRYRDVGGAMLEEA